MSTTTTPPDTDAIHGGEDDLEKNERDPLLATALYEKIIGQSTFSAEDGSFADRIIGGTGKLTNNGVDIFVQQLPNNGIRVITLAKRSDGIPFATCTIPADGGSNKVHFTGRYSTMENFYAYVFGLLPEQGVSQEEAQRLIEEHRTRTKDVLTEDGRS